MTDIAQHTPGPWHTTGRVAPVYSDTRLGDLCAVYALKDEPTGDETQALVALVPIAAYGLIGAQRRGCSMASSPSTDRCFPVNRRRTPAWTQRR